MAATFVAVCLCMQSADRNVCSRIVLFSPLPDNPHSILSTCFDIGRTLVNLDHTIEIEPPSLDDSARNVRGRRFLIVVEDRGNSASC